MTGRRGGKRIGDVGKEMGGDGKGFEEVRWEGSDV